MTQEELARRVGVTRQTIIALEAGKYVPSLYLAFKIARAFGAVFGLPVCGLLRFVGATFLNVAPTMKIFVIEFAFGSGWCSHKTMILANGPLCRY